MSTKTKPRIDKLRNNVKGEKGYRWDLGAQAFDNPGKKKPISNPPVEDGLPETAYC